MYSTENWLIQRTYIRVQKPTRVPHAKSNMRWHFLLVGSIAFVASGGAMSHFNTQPGRTSLVQYPAASAGGAFVANSVLHYPPAAGPSHSGVRGGVSARGLANLTTSLAASASAYRSPPMFQAVPGATPAQEYVPINTIGQEVDSSEARVRERRDSSEASDWIHEWDKMPHKHYANASLQDAIDEMHESSSALRRGDGYGRTNL